MEKEQRDLKNIKRLVIYLLLTFVSTYVLEIFLIAPLAGSTDENMAYLAQSMVASVMFIPTFAVLITRLVTGEGFQNLHIAISIKRNLKYIAIVWPCFALLIFLGCGLYFLIFPDQFDWNLSYAVQIFSAQAENEVTVEQVRQTLLLQLLVGILASPLINFVNCFGEEFGWRGYLLPLLLKELPVIPAVLVDGLIWGLWHAPLIALLGHNYGFGYSGFPVTGIIMMCVFCIVIGIILSYVTIKTGSIIPAVFGHGMLNGVAAFGIYLTSLQEPYNVLLGPAPTGLIGLFGFIVLAAYLLIRLAKEDAVKLEKLN